MSLALYGNSRKAKPLTGELHIGGALGVVTFSLLSCMLGKPSQRYSGVATRSVWRKVQNLKSLSAWRAKPCADTTDIRGSEAKSYMVNRQYLRDVAFFQKPALRVSIAETLSTVHQSQAQRRLVND